MATRWRHNARNKIGVPISPMVFAAPAQAQPLPTPPPPPNFPASVGRVKTAKKPAPRTFRTFIIFFLDCLLCDWHTGHNHE